MSSVVSLLNDPPIADPVGSVTPGEEGGEAGDIPWRISPRRSRTQDNNNIDPNDGPMMDAVNPRHSSTT